MLSHNLATLQPWGWSSGWAAALHQSQQVQKLQEAILDTLKSVLIVITFFINLKHVFECLWNVSKSLAYWIKTSHKNKTTFGLNVWLLSVPKRIVLHAVFGVKFMEPRLHDETLSVEMCEVVFQSGNIGLEWTEQWKMCWGWRRSISGKCYFVNLLWFQWRAAAESGAGIQWWPTKVRVHWTALYSEVYILLWSSACTNTSNHRERNWFAVSETVSESLTQLFAHWPRSWRTPGQPTHWVLASQGPSWPPPRPSCPSSPSPPRRPAGRQTEDEGCAQFWRLPERNQKKHFQHFVLHWSFDGLLPDFDNTFPRQLASPFFRNF